MLELTQWALIARNSELLDSSDFTIYYLFQFTSLNSTQEFCLAKCNGETDFRFTNHYRFRDNQGERLRSAAGSGRNFFLSSAEVSPPFFTQKPLTACDLYNASIFCKFSNQCKTSECVLFPRFICVDWPKLPHLENSPKMQA